MTTEELLAYIRHLKNMIHTLQQQLKKAKP